MILEAGYEGFTMFELGKVGIFVAIAGILYLFAFSSRLLPDVRTDAVKLDEEPEEHGDLHRVEAVLGARFPGINKKLGDFNFKRHYGAEVKEIKRSGQSIAGNLENEYLREGDTLVVMADDSFIKTWGGIFGVRVAGQWQGYGAGARKGKALVCLGFADIDDSGGNGR